MPETDSATQFQELYRLGMTQLRPEPIVFYKPRPGGDGVAAKFNLSLEPELDETEEYTKSVKGGLFLDLVTQGPKDLRGFPTFKWSDRESMITAKFGVPDVSGLLVAIRDFRVRGIDVATYLRGKDKTKNNVVSFFHKLGAETAAITYTFEEETSILRVSKSRDKSRSVSLSLSEELVLQRYLELSLDSFVRVGK